MRAISSKLELLSLNLELQKSEIKVVNQKTPITLRYDNDLDSLENWSPHKMDVLMWAYLQEPSNEGTSQGVMLIK